MYYASIVILKIASGIHGFLSKASLVCFTQKLLPERSNFHFSWGFDPCVKSSPTFSSSSYLSEQNVTFSSLLSIIENLYSQGFSTKLCMILPLRLLGIYKGCCIVMFTCTVHGLSYILWWWTWYVVLVRTKLQWYFQWGLCVVLMYRHVAQGTLLVRHVVHWQRVFHSLWWKLQLECSPKCP